MMAYYQISIMVVNKWYIVIVEAGAGSCRYRQTERAYLAKRGYDEIGAHAYPVFSPTASTFTLSSCTTTLISTLVDAYSSYSR